MAEKSSTIRYAEDYRAGEPFRVEKHTFTKGEIIAFGRDWHRQPFHLDEEFASPTIYGGLSRVAGTFHLS